MYDHMQPNSQIQQGFEKLRPQDVWTSQLCGFTLGIKSFEVHDFTWILCGFLRRIRTFLEFYLNSIRILLEFY